MSRGFTSVYFHDFSKMFCHFPAIIGTDGIFFAISKKVVSYDTFFFAPGFLTHLPRKGSSFNIPF